MSLEEVVGSVVDDVAAVLVYSEEYELPADVEGDVDVIEVSASSADVELPIDFPTFEERVKFGIEGAMANELVEQGDTLLCVDDVFDQELDTYARVTASSSMESGLYGLFMDSKAEATVIRDVLHLAIELGRKGQKGQPIGALFVVGDAGRVMERSRELSYNPFEKSHVHVGDPIVNVMLKEFSRLDGAFVISDAGKIVSAYRYLEAGSEGIDIPKGLGTRHVAAASISRETNAVSVVLSESDRMVRVFKGGELVLELDPEEV